MNNQLTNSYRNLTINRTNYSKHCSFCCLQSFLSSCSPRLAAVPCWKNYIHILTYTQQLGTATADNSQTALKAHSPNRQTIIPLSIQTWTSKVPKIMAQYEGYLVHYSAYFRGPGSCLHTQVLRPPNTGM